MNLSEFLENINKDVEVTVVYNGKTIMSAKVGLIDEEESDLYWVIPESVKVTDEEFTIYVEHQDDINRELENETSFSSIFPLIEKSIQDDRSAQELFASTYNKAKDYLALRSKWEEMSVEEVCRRNAERSMLHDMFISDLDALSNYIYEQTQEPVAWRVALGEDRKRLGDFAEYLINVRNSAQRYAENFEAILWATEHQSLLMAAFDNTGDCRSTQQFLMHYYGFNPEQAQAIVDMRCKVFGKDYRKKYLEDLEQMQARLKLFE